MEAIPKQNVFKDSNIDTLYKEKQLSRFDYVVEKIRDQFRILQEAFSEMYDPRYLAFLVDHVKHYAQKYPHKISDIKTQEDYEVVLSNYQHWGLEQCSKWKVTQIRNEIIRYDSETDFIHYLQTTVKENAENILSDDLYLKAQYEPYKTVLDEYQERAKLTTIQPEPATPQTSLPYALTEPIRELITSFVHIVEKQKQPIRNIHSCTIFEPLKTIAQKIRTDFEILNGVECGFYKFLTNEMKPRLEKYYAGKSRNRILTKTVLHEMFNIGKETVF